MHDSTAPPAKHHTVHAYMCNMHDLTGRGASQANSWAEPRVGLETMDGPV
jgi:hypothetical protein